MTATPDTSTHQRSDYERIVQELRGDELAALGEQLPENAQPDDEFVVSRRMALFVPNDHSLMRGEDCYYDSASTITVVDHTNEGN